MEQSEGLVFTVAEPDQTVKEPSASSQEAAQVHTPWYGDLSLPDNLAPANVDIIEADYLTSEANQQQREGLRQTYEYCLSTLKIVYEKGENRSNLAKPEEIREVFIRKLLEAKFLHSKAIQLGELSPDATYEYQDLAESMSQDLPRWYADLTLPDGYKFPHDDITELDISGLSQREIDQEMDVLKETYKVVKKSASEVLGKIRIHKMDIPTGRSYFATSLYETKRLHQKMIEHGFLKPDANFPCQALADTIPGPDLGLTESKWYDNLKMPDDFKPFAPDLLVLGSDASKDDRVALDKFYQELLATADAAMADRVEKIFDVDDRRRIFAAILLDTHLIHHKMIELGMLEPDATYPFQELTTAIPLSQTMLQKILVDEAKWHENLVIPETIKFERPHLLRLTKDASPRLIANLRNAYDYFQSRIDNALDNGFLQNQLPVAVRRQRLAADLVQTKAFHSKMIELGMLDPNASFPYQHLMDSVSNQQMTASQASQEIEAEAVVPFSELLSEAILASAEMASRANTEELLVIALRDTENGLKKLSEHPEFNLPEAAVEAAIVKRMIEAIGTTVQDPERQADLYVLEGVGNRLVTFGHVQAQRVSDGEHVIQFELAIRDYYRTTYPTEDMKEANNIIEVMTGRLIDYRPKHAPGLEWCMDDNLISCREGIGQKWRQSSEEEGRPLFSGDYDPLWLFPPVIHIDGERFLTYDGELHVIERELAVHQENMRDANEHAMFNVKNRIAEMFEAVATPTLVGKDTDQKLNFSRVSEMVTQAREHADHLDESVIKFLDRVQDIADRQLAECSVDILNKSELQVKEAKAYNGVLELVAASRELGLSDLPFSLPADIPESVIDAYQVVRLREAVPGDSPTRLIRSGEPLTKVAFAGPKEKPRAFAVADSVSREVVASFVNEDSAKAFTESLNSNTVILLPVPEPNKGLEFEKSSPGKPAPSAISKLPLSKRPSPPELSPHEEFGNALRDAGFIIDGYPTMDGTIQRVQVEGGKRGSKDGAYCGYPDGTRPAGWFANHKEGGEVKTWVATGHVISDDQKQALRAEMAANRAKREQQRLNDHNAACDEILSKILSDDCKRATTDHPYLEAKGVASYGLLTDENNNLLVVGLDLDKSHYLQVDQNATKPPQKASDLQLSRTIKTMQTIAPDGRKQFKKNCIMSGAMYLIGEDQFRKIAFEQNRPKTLFDDPKPGHEILIAEGYATGATLHKATGLPVAVAFNAGNLQPVAEALKRKFPAATLTICADNDHKLKANVGLDKGLEAAMAVNGRVFFPDFTQDERHQGLTDYNDLAQARGIMAVTEDITKQRLSMERAAQNKTAATPVNSKAIGR